MEEISNIDAIIELIMREARTVKSAELTSRAYMILSEIADRLSEILIAQAKEERTVKENKIKQQDFSQYVHVKRERRLKGDEIEG